ncbi:hypothetical protein ALC60_08363 [Trachymyrmex zeteki]|uniref:Uncharacterized protein n=1 Tax=Mycetomoellerius zeteki TaxID=64791 RepID=A0A151WX89_9HYME|nr:hypothetical protein ALC60_08363 [Trachymyrmex zeteki]
MTRKLGDEEERGDDKNPWGLCRPGVVQLPALKRSISKENRRDQRVGIALRGERGDVPYTRLGRSAEVHRNPGSGTPEAPVSLISAPRHPDREGWRRRAPGTVLSPGTSVHRVGSPGASGVASSSVSSYRSGLPKVVMRERNAAGRQERRRRRRRNGGRSTEARRRKRAMEEWRTFRYRSPPHNRISVTEGAIPDHLVSLHQEEGQHWVLGITCVKANLRTIPQIDLATCKSRGSKKPRCFRGGDLRSRSVESPKNRIGSPTGNSTNRGGSRRPGPRQEKSLRSLRRNMWIYFQHARDDDESFTRSIIGDSPSVTEFAETKAHVMLGSTRRTRRGKKVRGGREDGNGKKSKGYAPKLGLKYSDTPSRSP